jgi:hypothetical protein
MDFTYNPKTRCYTAHVGEAKYVILNGSWVTATRAEKDADGIWRITHEGPRKVWLSIGDGKRWATDLADHLGE